MPVGDQLTPTRFEVEWEGSLLVSPSRPSPSGLVAVWSTEFVGWWPTQTSDDLPTTVGAAPGARVWEAMYPTVTGVEARDAADVAAARALLGVGGGWGDLAWVDSATGVSYWAPARLQTVDPHPGPTLSAPVLVDLVWLVPRPDQVTAL